MADNIRLTSFPPIADKNSKILVLGTMPGEMSLRKQQYYGFPQNAFWKIMFTLFDKPLSEDYNERRQLMIDNKIALWDTLQYCERIGSGDDQIKNEYPNDYNALLKSSPKIAAIFLNGGYAEKFFKRHAKLGRPVEIIKLPSTSPANARIKFETKLAAWSVIKEYL